MTASILDCFGHWQVAPNTEEELASADAIVAHEFGDQHSASRATEAIVALALRLRHRLGKPIICQHPGSMLLLGAGVPLAAVIDTNESDLQSYLDTNEVNRQVAALCGERGWRRVIVCTHPHHLWRAGENLRTHGIEPLYPAVRGVRYDRACSRLRVRAPKYFIPAEIAARLIYRGDKQL